MTTVSSYPQRLYFMQLATANVPLPTGATLSMVCVCYLITMSDGTHILIDSGLASDVSPSMGSLTFGNEKNVLTQLAGIGLQPEDIDMMICTHFDIDHAGHHDSFKNAEFVVQRKHYEQARGGHPRYESIRHHWDDPALRYRQVDGDMELLPGVTLLETSGHALGHQSVLVRLPETGAVLLAIDAVALKRQFTPERVASSIDDSLEQLCASTQKLMDIAKNEDVALVVFGHDGEEWQTLTKSPEYYS